MSLKISIGQLQHEKGIKSSTMYNSYFYIGRHGKAYLLLRRHTTLVQEFDCCFRKISNWVLNFISVIVFTLY